MTPAASSPPVLSAAVPGGGAGCQADAVELDSLDTGDFVELYRRHYPRLVRSLSLAGATQQEAEDLAQEAFARTLGRWRRIAAGPNPPGYAYRVGFRLLARKRRGPEPEHREPDRDQLSTDRPDEEAVLASGVAQVLATLPPRQRECAVCCFVLGFTPLETGRILGIQPSTVRKHLDAARAAFGAVLRS